MKKPININGRDYFYEICIGEGEFQDFTYTAFFVKGEPVNKRVIKRKFIFFGPIIYDETIKVDRFIKCFEIGIDLSNGSIVDPEIIKRVEEKHNRKIVITDKELAI